MTRRAWLILAFGIILLTVVDAGYLSLIASYSAIQFIHQANEYNQNQNELSGPVFFVLIKFLTTIENFIRAHDTFFVVISTIAIAWFTGTLWRATNALVCAANIQQSDMQRSLKIAETAATASTKSADSSIKGVWPVLLPYITGQHLHPLERIQMPIEYDAMLLITFENYGKTPAIIREFRAKLVLTDNDQVPPGLDPKLWEPKKYDVIIPGDFRAKNLNFGALDFRDPVKLTPEDLDKILADGDAPIFKRFALVGSVIYDDLFGHRHTRIFCIKMRIMKKIKASRSARGINSYAPYVLIFQVSQGRPEYNRITTCQIPDPDPLQNA